MKTLGAVLEFAALAVIAVMVMAFFENAMATSINARAQANQTNALTTLGYNLGNGLLGTVGFNSPATANFNLMG